MCDFGVVLSSEVLESHKLGLVAGIAPGQRGRRMIFDQGHLQDSK